MPGFGVKVNTRQRKSFFKIFLLEITQECPLHILRKLIRHFKEKSSMMKFMPKTSLISEKE